ncbi:RNA polymerase factor sigma-32 [Stigmatella sp. ncwal1]|uniref:RNA polymerase sigma factor n=1 Tax=Stigmatella ashevillensis TaxID=2995309 RepID=A0ABT5D9X9_9BACT|nr:RNA polymerase factor sigma-32 [Stigmatella ashevillena]MDC0709869.1 RNA polymerase factor sigma-32 [Stigmatella ashevillena]
MANGRKRTKGTVSRPRAKRPGATEPEAGASEEAEEGQSEAVDPESLEPAPEELAEADAEIEDLEAPSAPVRALVPAEDVGLARRDPLQAYMAEVTRHPLLKREEEHALAKQYQQTGDVRAAYRLVASNLRLVVKLAHEYHRNPLSLLDLVQEGNIGLMQAVKKYDPDRGVKLSSYAAWWIRAYILRYIMDNWKMVKLGTTEAQRKLFFKLRQEQDKLVAQGFEPNPKLLAERLNVTEQDVMEMDQRLGHDEVSIDAPVGDESRASRADRLLPSSAVGAEERLGNEELKELFRQKLAEFAQTLEGKERFIFESRLTADEPLTLQDIGDKYGVSRERARQIEAALINRMREFMRERIPDFDLVAVPKG